MSKQPNYIRYVPAQDDAQPKIITLVEAQQDPLAPPKFRLNQKVPRPPPSPPAPVMHSPPRKMTSEDQTKWKIPPCVSSWKNPRGYTIPLDKRCALDGRSATQVEIINPKFAQLSETLYISTRQHRESLDERMKAEKLMAQKEKERNEEKLRTLAQQAREERAAVQRGLGRSHGDEDEEDDDDIRERKRIRDERHRERTRKINNRFNTGRERDIGEQIALGQARPTTVDDDHDQRLTENYASGFGDEDDYCVYDKAWKSKESFSTSYRPNIIDQEVKEPEKVDEPSSSSQPIQFESDDLEDVFNVESFLRSAKYKARMK